MIHALKILKPTAGRRNDDPDYGVEAGRISYRPGGMRTILMIALVALSLPQAVLAVNTMSLHNMPINHMTDEDRGIFKAAVMDVLERSRDGESTRWENSKTGAHGDLIPRASFERAGERCRDLEVANSARGRDNRLVVTLCRQADGDWKVDSQ